MRTPRPRRPRASRLVLLTLTAALTLPTLAVTAAAVAAPTTSVADDRAGAPTGTAAPSADGWRVIAVGADRYEVSWTSPTRLPLRSDRPTVTGAGLRVGPSTTAADGRTVRAVVTARRAPDPADLDVVLSGDRLDEPGTDRSDAGAVDPGPAARRGTADVLPRLDAADPGETGPFAVTTSDYELRKVRLPGLPRAVEMVGHVVEPTADAATGPRPLVLFLHGRHEVCYRPGEPDAFTGRWPCPAPFRELPSHLGYDYVQRLLASQGYATVSVRVNGINAQDHRLPDGGADARAAIVRRHLDHWTSIATEHRVDLSRVVLVGHSRGGEGVDRAALQVPLDAPYRIAGQVLLAPTDFASHTAPYVPTVTVLPYCDGDVSDLQGQKFTDVGRDLAADDTSLKSSVLVMGANHNFFNTEWTPGTAAAPARDDWGGPARRPCGSKAAGRLTAAQQRAVGQAYVAGAVRLFTAGADESEDAEGPDYLPLFDGSRVSVPSAGSAEVLSHAVGGGRDTRRPGLDATPARPTGGALTRVCDGVSSYDAGPVSVCGRRLGDVVAPHWRSDYEEQPSRSFLEMAWSAAGATGGLRFDDPLDLRADRLELRTIVDPRGPVRLRVRLTDGAGASATLTPEGGSRVAPLLVGEGVTKLWARSVLVDASTATGLDLADVTSVELVADNGRGRVWLADVSAAPARLAAVPETRLPRLQLGDLTIDEGDPGSPRPGAVGFRTAQVPFTVVGTLTRPATVQVVTFGEEVVDGGSSLQRLTVDLAPGQTSGTIPVDYTADNLDDRDLSTGIAAWGVRGIVADRYQATVTVRDDDPEPRVTVSTPTRVLEGGSIVVRVRLDRPVGYDAYVSALVVRSPGRPLRADDVPAAWLEGQVGQGAPLTRPLYQLGIAPGDEIGQGRRSATVVVPTARDGRREGTETVSFLIRLPDDRTVRRTVQVVDRAS